MPTSKNIVLELLREGPAHNQLLSPLTHYLAACQNRPPEPLRLSVEHYQFLRWQGGLTYADGGTGARRTEADTAERARERRTREARREAIDEAAKAVTQVLGSIRALAAELASDPCDWRHIHLVADAAELGALPFELAHAAPGLMVEGERLFLQQNARITLTRQTRRVATSVVSWPRRPRILCIVGHGDLPLRAHVLALRQAIDPLVGWNDGDASENESIERDAPELERLLKNRRREAEQMLTVLVDPTLDEVSREARRAAYTHVHVLAHGAPRDDTGPGQALYGLAFRHRGGGVEVVDGDRLEAALRQPRDCTHPTVVSLATCAGASVGGGILGPGGSVAHALHAKGVPLVVAAQFPLSKGASAIFTEMMYGGILKGEDPRQVIHAIRRELLVAHPETHDWASLVVYGSFPSDLDDQLALVRRYAEKLAAETAAERMRVTLRRWRRLPQSAADANDAPPAPEPADTATLRSQLTDRLRGDLDRLDRAVTAVRAWTDASRPAAARIAGHRLLARVALRLWDLMALPSGGTPLTPTLGELVGRMPRHEAASGWRPLSMLERRDLLELALASYEHALALDASPPQLWVQVAFLRWLIGHEPERPGTTVPPTMKPAASLLSMLNAARTVGATVWIPLGDAADRDAMSLRTATAFEAALLSQFIGATPPHDPGLVPTQEAFDDFVEGAAPVATSYRAHALWQQLRRYERVYIANFEEQVQSYRKRLEALGVRRYWGPRT
jgi:hypothetical protein